jgi:hypothetical protein
MLPPIPDPACFAVANTDQRTALLPIPLASALLPVLSRAASAREIVDVVAPAAIPKFASLAAAFPHDGGRPDFSFPAEERICPRFAVTSGVPNDVAAKPVDDALRRGSLLLPRRQPAKPAFRRTDNAALFRTNAMTNTGERPTQRPSGLAAIHRHKGPEMATNLSLVHSFGRHRQSPQSRHQVRGLLQERCAQNSDSRIRNVSDG